MRPIEAQRRMRRSKVGRTRAEPGWKRQNDPEPSRKPAGLSVVLRLKMRVGRAYKMANL